MKKSIFFIILAISVLLSVLFAFSSFAYADTVDAFKIAFYSNRNGVQGIYTMNDDGTEIKLLTNGRAPKFSPDGSKIVYMYYNGSTWDIFIMNANGSGIKNLTSTSNIYEGYPSFSPDGSKIIFIRQDSGHNGDVWVMNTDGTEAQNHTRSSLVNESYPIFSPDGSKIVFVQGYDIFIMDSNYDPVKVASSTNLTNNSSTVEEDGPCFSPDGTKIAYARLDSNGRKDIYTMDTSGGNLIKLTNSIATSESTIWYFNPSFSPDGSKIAFTYDDNKAQPEIYVMNSNGTGHVNLTNNSANDSEPAYGRAYDFPDDPIVSAGTLLTPEDWIMLDLNINQLLDHYGASSEGFIKMLYDNILGRVPDDKGLSDWVAALNNGVAASEVTYYIVFSDELNSKILSMSSEEFISFLYNQVLDRNPDAQGYDQWISFMADGNSKSDTLRAFLNNEEWFNICNMFNVTP